MCTTSRALRWINKHIKCRHPKNRLDKHTETPFKKGGVVWIQLALAYISAGQSETTVYVVDSVFHPIFVLRFSGCTFLHGAHSIKTESFLCWVLSTICLFFFFFIFMWSRVSTHMQYTVNIQHSTLVNVYIEFHRNENVQSFLIFFFSPLENLLK